VETPEALEGFPKHDELKSVFVECEFEDEEFGVQDDGFRVCVLTRLVSGRTWSRGVWCLIPEV